MYITECAVLIPTGAILNVSKISGRSPLTVNFSENSSNAVLWLWDFGDGEIPSNRMQPSPVHTYMRAGTYTVRLTVNGTGGSDSETATITVTDPRQVGAGH